MSPLIRELCQGKARRHDVERLIGLAALIVRQRLSGRIQAASRFQGSTPAALSLSLLGEVFSEGEAHKALIKHLLPNINEDDFALFLRFKAIVIRTASQGLFHRWHENDPSSARLWKNFHHALKTIAGIHLFPEDHPEFITAGLKTDCNCDLTLLEQYELAQIAATVIRPEMSMPEIIKNILRQIGDDYHDVPKALRIEHLFAAISETRLRLSAELWESASSAAKYDPHFDIIIQKARESAREQLEVQLSRYIEDGKLTSDEENKFGLALDEILADCVDGGPALCYFNYLCLNWPDLTSGEYKKNYRTRFEYLAKNIQRDFDEYMKRNL